MFCPNPQFWLVFFSAGRLGQSQLITVARVKVKFRANSPVSLLPVFGEAMANLVESVTLRESIIDPCVRASLLAYGSGFSFVKAKQCRAASCWHYRSSRLSHSQVNNGRLAHHCVHREQNYNIILYISPPWGKIGLGPVLHCLKTISAAHNSLQCTAQSLSQESLSSNTLLQIISSGIHT